MISIELEPHHFDLFTEIIEDSPLWKEKELKDLSLEEYINFYAFIQGEWRVWIENSIPLAITFTVDKAPSNNKMWLGTILIAKRYRHKGLARKIIRELATSALSNGEEAIFCGIPIEVNDWSIFLGKCGFEQFKVEQDVNGQNYLVLVYPLN